MTAWYASRYTGLFTRLGPLPVRPHDPRLAIWSGTAAWGSPPREIHASGIGWEPEAAEAATVGEAIERLQTYPLPGDHLVTAREAEWPLPEPPVPCERWVLFHAEQYRQQGFPFEPLTPATICPQVCCRRAITGEPWWVPAELVYLDAPAGQTHRLCPGLSTGLACGRTGDPVVLRGLQEVLERDALLGAWWGRYPVEEFAVTDVLDGLRRDAAERVLRPNLTYRCLRVVSPFCAHVALVTLAGEDREGWCFSVGSACRETAAGAWEKALLEAIHGRHYVRYLKQQVAGGQIALGACPTSFAEHAVWYSERPGDLERTILARTQPRGAQPFPPDVETVASLAERLGPDRPVLFRDLTPPALATEGLGWHVLRVVVPGLQPLHGDHRLPHLGGPLWAPRGLANWQQMPPHPSP
jgi:ribosomal protein S12 methylthiotransferase accessory factor